MPPEGVNFVQAQVTLLGRGRDRSLVGDDTSWLRSKWDGPALTKRVQYPEDARQVLHYGVDGLIVSSHGGSQLNCGPSTINVLPQIMDIVKNADAGIY